MGKNKVLLFVFVSVFGLAMAVLGAQDLRNRLAAKKAAGTQPDPHQMIEDLKQSEIDPYRAMIKKEDGAQADTTQGGADQGTSSITETLGIDQMLEVFDQEPSEEEN